MSADKTPDFEKQMLRLQKIVESLEGGELPLEKGVALYKEGLGIAASCKRKLAEARHAVTVRDGDILKAFDECDAPEDDEGDGA